MRNKKGQFVKGYTRVVSEETKKKISKGCKKSKVGKWMKGRKLSEETKAKVKKNNAKYWLGKDRPNLMKGNLATVGAIHKWIETKLGKAKNCKCKHCGK